jgi:hypothetical protein
MRDEKMEDMLLKVLRSVAPGRPLREGLENVLRAKNGGLIVLAENPEVMGIVEGGFMLNADYSPSHLYELAKMDGAIILSKDAKKILAANTQMVPSQDIPSSETGIRHRTAERVARQTGTLVIAISQRRGVITLYKGTLKYVLQDLGLILTKANQAIQTLEKYRVVLDKFLLSLSVMEFQESVTLLISTKPVSQNANGAAYLMRRVRRPVDLSSLFQQRHGIGGHTFASAGEAKTFSSSGFNIDRTGADPQGRGEIMLHFFHIGSQLGPLGHYKGVYIPYLKPPGVQQGAYFGQKHQAADALITLVMVRKMAADVTFPGGSQQCVHNGVNQHVRVRMPQKPFLKGYADPSQNQLPVCHQFVHIITKTDPHRVCPLTARCPT